MAKTISALFVLSAALLCTAPAQAQVGFGLKLGVPPTDAFKVIQTASPGTSQHFTWGPYLELHLPGGNGIEIDALRRAYDFQTSGNASTWEFPVVVKHRIGNHIAKPYFEGGASFSRLSDVRISTLNHRSNYGLVVGGGVEINMILFKISPEIRYTGWTLRTFDGGIQSNRNQMAVLLGIGF